MLKRFLIRLILMVVSVIAGLFLFDYVAGRCKPDPDVAAAIASVSSGNLSNHVATLSGIGSRYRRVKKSSGVRSLSEGPEELQTINRNLQPIGFAQKDGNHREQKLAYLEQELAKIGLEGKRYSFATKKIGMGINLVCEITGQSQPQKVIDLTAHYDAFVDSPGADDNHSGVAGVLEIARILKSSRELARTVRLVFFDFEELGLIGSRAYLSSLENHGLQVPELCLNLEMIGYFSDQPNTQTSPARIPILFEPPTVGNTIITVGNLNSYRYGRRLDGTITAYTPLPVFSVSRWGDLLGNASRSDHASYWEAGIPALMLTDSANFRNPHYHKPTDQPDTLDYDRMRLVTQAAAGFVLNWAR